MTFLCRGRTIGSTVVALSMISHVFGMVAPTSADPLADSRLLYFTIVRHRAAMMDLLAFTETPKTQADLIQKYVYSPVNAAGGAWVNRAFEQGEQHYRPFSPCLSAATALTDTASRVMRFLRGADRDLPIIAASAHLREVTTGCEIVLDKAQAAPELGSRLD